MLNKKLHVWLPLLFSMVMIAGMFFGYKLGRQQRGKGNFFSAGRQGVLPEVLDLIRMKYVDSLYTDSLEGKAIREMVNLLDPHSVYLPPDALKEANEDLAGNFEGIGVEFNIFNDTVNVVYVMPGGPGEKAGIQAGDKLLQADQSPLTGKSLSSEQIKKQIRGPKGSEIRLRLQRGREQKEITVIRGTIPVPSVEASYMMDKSTGYIKLNKFTESSYEEFMQAMEKLQKEGLRSLVFDLRGNGGGFMNEAVDIADEFLAGDKLIVYTKGVNSKKREYRCKRPGLFENGKLIILVDELSASASEVLAGALQDWCRATIVGRRTFGKGLVQEQYPLSDGSAIRLTIARYYTPLGRSIQRSYEKGKKVYLDELWERYNRGELVSVDSANHHKEARNTFLACRDTLYDNEGISPSVFVPVDTTINRLLTEGPFSSTAFSKTAYQYFLQHQKEINGFANVAAFNSGFSGMEQLWNAWLQSLPSDSMKQTTLSAPVIAYLQNRLKALVARYKWRDSGFWQVMNETDSAIKKLRELLASQ